MLPLTVRQLFRQDCEAVYCSLVVQHPLGSIPVQKRKKCTNSKNHRVADLPKPRVRVTWHFAVVSMGVSNEPCEGLTYSRPFSTDVFTKWKNTMSGWHLQSRWDVTEAFVDHPCSTHSHLDGQCVFMYACPLALMLQPGILPGKHQNHKQISGTYRSLLVMFASCFMQCVAVYPQQYIMPKVDYVSGICKVICIVTSVNTISFNCWFRRRSKKISIPRVTGICAVAGEFPAEKASNAFPCMMFQSCTCLQFRYQDQQIFEADGVPVRIFVPENRRPHGRGIMFFHGSDWMNGSVGMFVA